MGLRIKAENPPGTRTSHTARHSVSRDRMEKHMCRADIWAPALVEKNEILESLNDLLKIEQD